MVVSARSGYDSPLSKGEILALGGYSNGDAIKADCNALIRILKGAFSSLIEKKERVGSRLYAAYSGDFPAVYSEDAKAKEALEWFYSYGLWNGDAFSGDQEIDLAFTRRLLQRIFSYLGAKPEEDYYTYANNDRLFNSSLKVSSGDSFYEQKIVEQSGIDDFYVSFLNSDSPSLYSDFAKGAGLGSLKAYADKILGATASNFWEVMTEVSSSSGAYLFSLNGFFPAKEGDERPVRISLGDGDSLKALKKLIEKPSSLRKLFSSFGYDSSTSSSLCEALSSYFSSLEPLAPEFDPSSLSEEMKGYVTSQVGDNYPYSFSGSSLMKTVTYLGHGLDEKSLKEGKAYAVSMLAYAYRALLDKGTREELGFSSSRGDEGDFLSLTQDALKCYFVNEYSSSEKGKESYAKARELGEEARDLIIERLPGNAWLSEKGQEAIRNKLGKIEFVVGATCEAHPSFDLEVDASSLEKALSSGYSSYWKAIRGEDAQDPDLLNSLYGDLLMPNASYNYYNHTVDLTLGLLCSYGNDLASLPSEELYGCFLLAFTHEITHSIDAEGVTYDERGEKVDGSILGEADLEAYEKKQEKVKALHVYESLPGAMQDSDVTLSEDIADFSGLAISEKIYAKHSSKTDWEAYYKAIARHFYSACSYASWTILYYQDVHSFGKPRVNALFANSPNFISYYKVNELNGMYAAPSDQVVVW